MCLGTKVSSSRLYLYLIVLRVVIVVVVVVVVVVCLLGVLKKVVAVFYLS